MQRETLLLKIKVQVDMQFSTREEAAEFLGISGAHLSRVIAGKHSRIPESILKWLGYEEHLKPTYSKIRS